MQHMQYVGAAYIFQNLTDEFAEPNRGVWKSFWDYYNRPLHVKRK